MTALPIEYDPVPDSLSGQPTLFQQHEQTLLDLAALSQLTSETPSSRVTDTVANLASLHDVELVKNLETRAALLDSEATFVDEDLRQREAFANELQTKYARRAALRDSQLSLNELIVRAQVELLGRRQKTEEERLEHELDLIRSEEASLRAQNDDPSPDDPPSSRQRRITQLQQRRDEILKTEAPAFEREEYLRCRWITRTVAGFLLWLGYASVVATGSVLALIMSGRKAFDLHPLVAGTRAIVASILPTFPAWFRLSVILCFLTFLLLTIIGVFLTCDEILRDRWQWHAEKKSRQDASAQMAPQALTTRTYARFIALLPFVFLAAFLLVVLVLAPTLGGSATDDAGVLMSIFPSVGYSFIGIAIAFLATGVFMMYFIRVIEPRSAQGGAVLLHSWEFAIPPLLLVLALAVAPYQLSISAGAWLPWAAFMLMSSLALACGLVFHGIFKDARMARDRVIRIDRRLQRLTGVPADDDEDTEEERTPLVTERRRLERVLRAVRFGRVRRSAPEEAPPQTADTSGRDELSKAAPIPASILVPEYRAIDMVVAPELVVAIENHRGTLRRIDTDLHDVQIAIAQLEPLVSPEALSKQRERGALLKGMKLALATHQEERRQHVRIDQEILLLKIATTQSATQAVSPLIAAVKHPLAPPMPFADKGATQ